MNELFEGRTIRAKNLSVATVSAVLGRTVYDDRCLEVYFKNCSQVVGAIRQYLKEILAGVDEITFKTDTLFYDGIDTVVVTLMPYKEGEIVLPENESESPIITLTPHAEDNWALIGIPVICKKQILTALSSHVHAGVGLNDKLEKDALDNPIYRHDGELTVPNNTQMVRCLPVLNFELLGASGFPFELLPQRKKHAGEIAFIRSIGTPDAP